MVYLLGKSYPTNNIDEAGKLSCLNCTDSPLHEAARSVSMVYIHYVVTGQRLRICSSSLNM